MSGASSELRRGNRLNRLRVGEGTSTWYRGTLLGRDTSPSSATIEPATARSTGETLLAHLP